MQLCMQPQGKKNLMGQKLTNNQGCVSGSVLACEHWCKHKCDSSMLRGGSQQIWNLPSVNPNARHTRDIRQRTDILAKSGTTKRTKIHSKFHAGFTHFKWDDQQEATGSGKTRTKVCKQKKRRDVTSNTRVQKNEDEAEMHSFLQSQTVPKTNETERGASEDCNAGTYAIKKKTEPRTTED